MRKNKLIFAALLGVVGLTACDEGDIQEQNGVGQTAGKTAKLTATITGMDTWSPQYSVVLAGFAEGNDNAVVQKRLPDGVGDDVTTTLSLTADDIETVELCVTNRLRQRVVTFASVSVSQMQGDTVFLHAGNVNLGMFQSIQDVVFTSTCARCHGLGSSPAGSLTLVEGQSYEQLVNHPARLPQNGIRVVPGDPAASLLHKVVHGDPEAGVSFDHSNMLKAATAVSLIDNWIAAGAQP